MKSVSMLESGLPIDWDTSVHVAIDDSRQDMMRVLILPSQDTPYSNGAFIFDMMLPESFPEVSPSVCASLPWLWGALPYSQHL
jgi:baculoviral IAP repeat-containing protein 6